MPTLEERVAALEAALASGGNTDTIQPNVLTVNPDGTIGADFTGRIDAEGITFTAESSQGIPTTISESAAIQWVTGPGGSLVAQIGGSYGFNPTQELTSQGILEAVISPSNPNARAQIELSLQTGGYSPNFTFTPGVNIEAWDPNGTDGTLQVQSGKVTATAGQELVDIIRSDGSSDLILPKYTYAAVAGSGVQAIGTTWVNIENGVGGNLGDGSALTVPSGDTYYAKVDLQFLFQANSANWTPIDAVVYAWSPASGPISGINGAAGETNGNRVRNYSYGAGSVGQPSWTTVHLTDIIKLPGGNSYAFYPSVISGQDGSAYGCNVNLTAPWAFITGHRVG